MSAIIFRCIRSSPRAPFPPGTMALPQSPSRSRSVSQPIREGVVLSNFATTDSTSLLKPSRSAYLRSQSSSSVNKANGPAASGGGSSASASKSMSKGGRARSSSLVTVTEVGGDEPENVVDRVGGGTNENANWVNAPGMLDTEEQRLNLGAWIMHPVLILVVKVLVDSIPSMTQDVSWTVVNLSYMAVRLKDTTSVAHDSSLFSCFIMSRACRSNRRR